MDTWKRERKRQPRYEVCFLSRIKRTRNSRYSEPKRGSESSVAKGHGGRMQFFVAEGGRLDVEWVDKRFPGGLANSKKFSQSTGGEVASGKSPWGNNS